jgi:membrane peptidoglycan carboxypeptidase
MKLRDRKSIRGRFGKNFFVTKSGKKVKLNRTISEKVKAGKNLKAQRKAAYLGSLPKNKIKRFFARFHPKRMAEYWFSRDGGIMALKILGVSTVLGFLLLVGLFSYFRKDLPNLKDISGSNIGGSIRYYDRSGQTLLWEDYDAVKRIPVKDEQISPYIKQATVAVEDKDFFKHGGFDVRGIARAGLNNVTGGGGTQGGSTITQQLVKLTQNWTKDQSYTRKVKELILAVELERSYSKQEILTGYLNAAPYGNVQYGVEAASRDYFQKSAKDLTLDQAAFLAAIPKSPSFYSPYGSYYKNNETESKPELVKRQHYILDLMEQQGMITKAQRDDAKKVDTLATIHEPQPKFAGMKAPWYVMAAKQTLEDKYGSQTVKRGGWVVTTALDMSLQNEAENQVNKGLAQVRRQGGDTAAFAAEDVTNGQMVALVGGADFNDPDHGQFNYATSPLPPGSSFKPYDYVSMMENTTNTGAGSVLYDSQGPLEGYPCTNKAQPKQGGNCLWDYDFRYPGAITARYALGGSRNVPAVKAMLTAGVNKTIDTAEKLGLKSGYKCYQDEALTKDGQCYSSSAIGDGAFLRLDQHVHAYSSISRNGKNLPQTYILKITDSQNKTIDEWKPTKGDQAVRPDSAYIVADMMSDPNASYFPAGRKPQRYTNKLGTWKFAMKTGTTNDGKDGWMMGFSTKYAAGVWVGYHTRQRVMSGTMENMTQPIWQGWMQAAHANLAPVDREKPSGVQTLPAYVIHSHVGIGSVEPSPATDLFPSWYKQQSKTGGSKAIDKVSNKLATSCTPDRAKDNVGGANANIFSADIFFNKAGSAANTSDSDDVHNCSDAKPSITVTATGCTIVATVSQGTHPLNSDAFPGVINFIISGQTVSSSPVSESPSSASYTAPAGTTSVSAQVIDSVLYDASDTVNTDCASASNPLTIQNQSDTNANTATISWVGGAPTFSVKVNGTPYPSCQGISTQSCVVSLPANGTYSVIVTSDSTNETSSTSFKKT